MLTRLKQRNQKVEIKVRYSPPPDGSYPPRLLVFSKRHPGAVDLLFKGQLFRHSVWLPDGKYTALIPDEIAIEHNGDSCNLIPLNALMSDVHINGQPLTRTHVLADGDFIHWRDWRGIFQADPVKDRRIGMGTKPEIFDERVISINPKLAKWVVMNEEGISFNGGKDFAAWDEIDFLGFSHDMQSNTILYYVYLTGKRYGKTLASKLASLKPSDAADLTNWIRLCLPFDLCFNVMIGKDPDLYNLLPDAYYAAAVEKIQVPAMNNQRSLPADENFIFGILSIGERIRGWGGCILQGLAGLTIITVILALIDQTDAPFMVKWLPFFIKLVAMASAMTALMFIGMLLDNGINWLRRRVRQRTETKKADAPLGN